MMIKIPGKNSIADIVNFNSKDNETSRDDEVADEVKRQESVLRII